jgi:predicted short-subunit dehydrogenase-like oxidoreductase (DUF2520 family)
MSATLRGNPERPAAGLASGSLLALAELPPLLLPAPSSVRRAGPAYTAGLRVHIIGRGRVGGALGTALTGVGHEVLVEGQAAGGGTLARSSLRGADLVVFAVPDDALAGLVRDLVEGGSFEPGQVVAHTSGAQGLAVLDPATAVGVWSVALHPAMTFIGAPSDVDRLTQGITFGVTATNSLRPFVTRLVADLNGRVEWIAEADRALYHAALVHGANHLVTLINEALDLLGAAGISDPARVLGPLARAALENTLVARDDALTGPVVRGDARTVGRHLSALGEAAPESVPGYVALARRTANRAIAANRLTVSDADRLLDVLGHLPAGDLPTVAS